MYDILRLIYHTGPVAKGVLFILFLFSIISWALILQKIFRLLQVNRASKAFLDIFRQKKNWGELYKVSRSYLKSPYAKVLIKEFQEYYYHKKEGSETGEPAVSKSARTETVKQAAETAIQDELSRLDKYLPFLATTVSISPFLGLFGTVWGVMEAFIRIGQQGSSDIGTVGPGIAEALITTVVGLAVAIPALAAYNLLVAAYKRLEGHLGLFAQEFALSVEREQTP